MLAPDKLYSDYIQVRDSYAPTMTKREINEKPDKWLEFFPHQKYCEFVDALLNCLESGKTSVWLYGNFGTGKSHAALVTQKLFMDVQERVDLWFKRNNAEFSDPKGLKSRLDKLRKEGTLVVYDYNAEDLGPGKDFLVRLEKGVRAALEEVGMKVPGNGKLDEIEARLRREGDHFFDAIAQIEDKLSYLPTYKSIDEIVKKLRDDKLGSAVLDEVQQTFHHDGIFLDVDVPSFLEWIQKVRDVNGLTRVVYIFDEFSSFIEANRTQLKTLEEVTENPYLEGNRFYFVPVTHMDLKAFAGENSQTARRAKDRFVFSKIEMPDDVAFRLTAHAFKVDEKKQQEWNKTQEELASYVRQVVDRFSKVSIKIDSFTKILPIHPMTAFLLKYLSESARSNQRSIFEYVSGKDFKNFIKSGGPSSKTARFLTVDQLWEYFIIREDLGVVQDVERIRREFANIRQRILSNSTDDSDEIRVLKAVFLFVLISDLREGGNDLIQPTIDNVELAFKGTDLVNVSGVIEALSKRNCFSLANRHISLFISEAGTEDEIGKTIEEYSKNFNTFLREPIEKKLKDKINTDLGKFFKERFDIRVSDPENTSLGSITKTRDRYSKGINKDDGSVCLWFIAAKDENDKTSVQEKAENVLTQLRDHRILMFSFGNCTFCEDNAENWRNYVKLRAQESLATDSAQKIIFKKSYIKIQDDWFNRIKKGKIDFYRYDDEAKSGVGVTIEWGELKGALESYIAGKMPCLVDLLSGYQTTVFDIKGLKQWALAGINGNGKAQYSQLINRFIGDGVVWDEQWFDQNPEHTLSKIRAFFDKKIKNTVGEGGEFSLRKVYLELKRAPYGMRPCGITAFCLGFCLRFLLAKGYQWTDKTITKELDADSLAEIIEMVVKDDGEGKIKNEKTICRLSRDEKAFVKRAPEMFGVKVDSLSRVEDALARIQESVRQLSDRAPLWTLHYAIDLDPEVDEKEKRTIQDVLSKLCSVCRVSSKSKTSDFTSNVKEIGGILNANPDLIKIVARYAKREHFKRAFELYVDEMKPELQEQAKKVGDVTRQYCRAILDKVADEAGVLWNESDFTREIDQTFAEYEAIERCQTLLGAEDFLTYDQVVKQLRSRVRGVNVPKDMILETYPSLEAFLSATDEQNGSASKLNEALTQCSETMREVFFDAQRKKVLELVRAKLSNTVIPDDELRKLMDSIEDAFSMTPQGYEAALSGTIEEYEKNSAAVGLANAWKTFSGCDTPDEWSAKNHLPAYCLFDDDFEAADLFKALARPENYAKDVLIHFCDRLEAEGYVAISACQKRFMKKAIPARYSGFNIQIGELTQFLEKKHGSQPNQWPFPLGVEEFVSERYRYSFAPQIVEKVGKMGAEELKSIILKLVETNQDVGMLFWE